MYKLITFPPFYILGCPIFCLISYCLFPYSTLIASPFNLVGVIPSIIGLQVMTKAHKLFTKNETTFYLEEPSILIVEGNYKFSRNPMYLGSLLIIIGLSILFGHSTALISPVLFFLGINFLCVPLEERLMEKTFENDYLIYKNNVRRWI
ncbi:MAG: DUF1295 domain-containing protein [Marinilabiliaceae bacterium]|nr:DUF1295 domain-containing protein [Marinilabiliaceae bacterium]